MRKTLFWFLLIVFVYSGVGVATAQQKLTFEDIFSSSFRPRTIDNINWMKDGRYYTTLYRGPQGTEIRKYDIVTGEHESVVTNSELTSKSNEKPFIIQSYQYSADESQLLIETDVEHIWRRSTKANYYVFNLNTRKLQKLTQKPGKQQYAQFSPKGDRVAFVRDNNLYWVDLKSGQETQITTDGEFNKIINGASDWVYEEEFSFAKAWFWSPDGERIAFYRFDERRVPEYQFPWYQGDGEQYPGIVRYKYPKAGHKNSIVKIGVYDIPSDTIKWIDVGSERDQYIVRVNWTQSSDILAIRRMNRLQNKQELMFANPGTGNTHIVKTEKSDTWIDENDDLTFLENGMEFIYVSEEDGYNHIYLYNMDGSLERKITRGDWEVTKFLGYNRNKKRLYYVSTEDSPLERQMYSIKIDGSGKQKMTHHTGWHNINMSRDFKYYIDEYSNSTTPPVFTLHNGEGKQIRVLEDNGDLKEELAGCNFPTKEFMKINLPEAGTLNAYMMKPPNFDPHKKYPVLMYVYGGPGSQTVTREYDSGQRAMWHRYLASLGYIIFSIDNRGTGARGRDFEKQVYKHLGKYETIDQAHAAKYLQKLDYVDPNRIGIWGWSYGGYMTAMALTHSDVFEMGISVSPVTSWKYYDTIYTERFMQTPQLNPEGYKESAPLNYADQLHGKYLLVHGTGDDNVHFQNSIEWVNALIKADKQFQTMYYPDRNHGIYGGNTRHHLFRLLTNFVEKNL